VLQAGYPPFGLANVSYVGISSFLILSGLYNSAISVANDVRVRQSIKNSAINESKLLGSIGTAEMQQEISKGHSSFFLSTQGAVFLPTPLNGSILPLHNCTPESSDP